MKPDDLTNLPKYYGYARLLHDGMPLAPFSLVTIKSPLVEEGRGPIVRRISNEQNAKRRELVLAQFEQSGFRPSKGQFATEKAQVSGQLPVA